MTGQRQQLGRFAGDGVVRPEPVHGLAGLPGVPAPADLEAALDGPVTSAGIAVEPHEVGVRLDAHITVGHTGGQLDGFLAEPGHEDGRRRVGGRIQAGRIDPVMRAVVSDETAAEQLPDHLDRFIEHVQALFRRRPCRPEDVLVQRLPAADTQREPPAGQQRRGGGRLGDDRGMGPQQRAGHRRRYRQRRGLRNGADHRPDEAALTLFVQPRDGSGRISTRHRIPLPRPAGPAGRAPAGCSPRTKGSIRNGSCAGPLLTGLGRGGLPWPW